MRVLLTGPNWTSEESQKHSRGTLTYSYITHTNFTREAAAQEEGAVHRRVPPIFEVLAFGLRTLVGMILTFLGFLGVSPKYLALLQLRS